MPLKFHNTKRLIALIINYVNEQRSLIKKLKSIKNEIDNILNKKKFSDVELIMIAIPIIKESLRVKISDPF